METIPKPLVGPVEATGFVRALRKVGLVPDSEFITGVYISVTPAHVDIQVTLEADDRIYDIVPELAQEKPSVA